MNERGSEIEIDALLRRMAELEAPDVS